MIFQGTLGSIQDTIGMNKLTYYNQMRENRRYENIFIEKWVIFIAFWSEKYIRPFS